MKASLARKVVAALHDNASLGPWLSTQVDVELSLQKFLKLLRARKRLLRQVLLSKSIVWDLKALSCPREFFAKISGFLPSARAVSSEK